MENVLKSSEAVNILAPYGGYDGHYHLKHYDDCEDRKAHGNMLSCGWAIFAILVILIIAFIWQRNNHHRYHEYEKLGKLEAKAEHNYDYARGMAGRYGCYERELGELQAKTCDTRQWVGSIAEKQYCDEKFIYSHVNPYNVPTCCPERGERYGCGERGYGYGRDGYGRDGYGRDGRCGEPLLFNGCCPERWPIPVTKFNKETTYTPTATVVTERETV